MADQIQCSFIVSLRTEHHCASLLILIDVDECANPDRKDCHVDASCNNTEGSYTCRCLDGFQGDGKACTGKPYNWAYDAIHVTRFLHWYETQEYFTQRPTNSLSRAEVTHRSSSPSDISVAWLPVEKLLNRLINITFSVKYNTVYSFISYWVIFFAFIGRMNRFLPVSREGRGAEIVSKISPHLLF